MPAAGGLLAIGVIAAVLLVRQETRAASPLIPLALLHRPTIWRSDALAACHGAALAQLPACLEDFALGRPASDG